MRARSWPMAVCAVLVLISGEVRAQEPQEATNFSAQRFFPAKTREGILDTESAGIARGALDLALWLNYARNPIVLYTDESGSLDRSGSLVQNRLEGHLIMSAALWQWFELGFDLGIVLYQNREDSIDVAGQVTPLTSLSSVGLGDIRILPKIQVLRAEWAGVDLAIIVPMSLPTGGSDQYFGDTSFTVAPALAISREFDQGFRFAANVGYRIREGTESLDLSVDNQWFYRLGYAYRFDANEGPPLELGMGISGEADGESPFASSVQSPLEILGQIRYDVVPSTQLFVGAGAGIGRGVGAPDVRVFGGLAYSVRHRDKDGDGIRDARDRCPDEAEDLDGFEDRDGCPDPDNDRDGILDVRDRCEDEPEDMDGFEDEDGCPEVDNDGDGLADADDRCPIQVGLPANQGCPDRDSDGDGVIDRLDHCPAQPEDGDDHEDEDGCPDTDNDADGVTDVEDGCPNTAGPIENRGCPDRDRDGDTVVDRLDNCPDEPGPIDNQGCKRRQLVQIRSERLEILDKVYFVTGSAKLQKRSFPLLLNIAAVLKAHPEIETLIVEGHTDSQGSEAFNKSLSQKRADSVMRFLVQQGGVEASRAEAIGYGEERPIDSNDTASGRAANRRVEFTIPTRTRVEE